MLQFAPRLSPIVQVEIERLSRRSLPIAEINRRVGRAAWRSRLPKPSYERVRVLVHAARMRARFRRCGVPRLEIGVALAVGATLRLALGRGRTTEERRPGPRGSPLRP